MPQSQLTPLTERILKQKLREVVTKMAADGLPESAIRGAIEEFQSRHFSPVPEEQSTLGALGESAATFAGNAARSAGRLVSDITAPLHSPRVVAGNLKMLAQNPGQAASALWEGVKERYGSPSAYLNTVYDDPLGVAADVASLVGGVGAGLRGAGAATGRAGLSRAGRTAVAAGDAANPVRALTAPIKAGAHKVGQTIVRGTLRPSAAIRREFGGGKGVADTVLSERVFSEPSANRALARSAGRVRGRIDQSADAPPVQASELLDDIMPVTERAAQRTRLGMPDETDTILNRIALMEKRNPGGISLSDAQSLKQEAQDLAERVYRARDRGADVIDLGGETNAAIASGLRGAIEKRVPEVAGENQRTQALIGARRAFADAGDRPHALSSMTAAGLGGGGIAAGSPAMLAAAALPVLMNSPRLGAAMGIGINQVGRAAGSAELARAALLSRLLGQEE